MLTILPLILQLIEAGITVVPELIAAGKTEISLITGTSPPTAEQQAQIEAAVVAANNALQASQPAATG
jgi:hypothetical protein